MNFATYLIRRVLSSIPLLLGISIILYGVLHLAPGGPIDVYADNPSVTPEALENLKRELGLDQPVPIQYLRWLRALAQGEWGYSIRSGRPVVKDIAERIPPTLVLGGTAFTLALLVALPLGILSALRRYSLADYSFTFLSFLGISMPIFWLALMLQALFAVKLHILPSAGLETIGDGSLTDRLRHLILPACILAVANIASWGRFVRSSMLDVLGLDYIRTARAKGLSERVVVYRHALRNALLPIITIVGLQFGALLGGAVITETIFAWPGLGRLVVNAISQRDYPVVQGGVILVALLVSVVNLVVDLAYALVNPKIRYA